MDIRYIISASSERRYNRMIRARIKELKSNKLDTESHICDLIRHHAKKHECIDTILPTIYCELTFWNDDVTVHTVSRCSLNNVHKMNERFGFCEMFFSYDNDDDEIEAIVKVYKFDYCSLD